MKYGFMNRFGPLIIVSSLICMTLLWVVYAMRHGYFATTNGGSHEYIVYSTIDNVISKCDSLQRINDFIVNQDDFCKDSLTAKETPCKDYFRFPIRVDNRNMYVQIKLIGSSREDKTELLLRCFSYDMNFFNPIKIGDVNQKDREQLLKAFENQIMGSLGVSYDESWGQYY